MSDIELTGLSTATLHEVLGKTGALPSCIKPLRAGMRLLGPAFPLGSPAGDNLMLHHALEQAPPGSVIVADAGGFVEAGPWGDVMTAAAKARGISGLVIYGSIRDSAELAKGNFPIFCAGVCIRGTTKTKRAPINVPVMIGDVTVAPGDLVVGDDDGVVIVPVAQSKSAAWAAAEREASEEAICERLEAGELTLDIYGLR